MGGGGAGITPHPHILDKWYFICYTYQYKDWDGSTLGSIDSLANTISNLGLECGLKTTALARLISDLSLKDKKLDDFL